VNGRGGSLRLGNAGAVEEKGDESMRLYVPQPGEAATLLRPWTFTLHPERRNVKFHRALFPCDPTWGEREGYPSYRKKGEPKQITLPASTKLVFDRVYVRQGAEDYASLTFVVKAYPSEALVGERFWAKLDDANTMDIERTTSGNPVGPFAKGTYRRALQESKDPELAQKNAKKRAGAEAAKKALSAAREYVQVLVFNASKGPVNMHLENIVTEALRELKTRHPGWVGFNKTREGIMWDMSRKPYRKKDPHSWACVKTTVTDDDNVVRELRYVVCPSSPDPKKLGGFRLTMRGTQVLSCESLE
jgi:hypothetical protein